MKLKDLSDLIIFDAFPLAYDAKQKIILTHLLHLEQQTLPQKLPTIYTTKRLAKQFSMFCGMKDYKGAINFIYLEPLNWVEVIIEKRRTIQLMAYESQDSGHNLMVLLMESMINGKLTYLYAGNVLDIRTAVLEDALASRISEGVEKLYVNLKRSEEKCEEQEVNLLTQVLNNIEIIIEFHQKMRFVINMPMFACENFINQLANRFRKNILLISNLSTLYNNFIENDETSTQNFSSDPQTAKIFVKENIDTNMKDAHNIYQHHNTITINLKTEAKQCRHKELHLKNFCYDLYYTPEPSPFDLQLLCLLCKPKRIYGIIDVFNNKSKVPHYLLELCDGANTQQTSRLKSPIKTPIFVSVVPESNRERMTKRRQQFLSDSDTDEKD